MSIHTCGTLRSPVACLEISAPRISARLLSGHPPIEWRRGAPASLARRSLLPNLDQHLGFSQPLRQPLVLGAQPCDELCLTRRSGDEAAAARLDESPFPVP